MQQGEGGRPPPPAHRLEEDAWIIAGPGVTGAVWPGCLSIADIRVSDLSRYTA